MDNRIVRLGRQCLRGVAGLALATLLLTGCRSTPKSQEYVDIPELPGTPIGTPVATNPAPVAVSVPDTSAAPATPSPALSTPASALSTPAVPPDATPTAAIGSSSVATTQISATGSSDAPAASATKVTQKHAPAATAD